MTEQNIDSELQSLLNALTEHGRNTRRQNLLLHKIDQLAAKQKRKRYVWVASVFSAAACLFLIVFVGNKDPQIIASAEQYDTATRLHHTIAQTGAPSTTATPATQIASKPTLVAKSQQAQTPPLETPATIATYIVAPVKDSSEQNKMLCPTQCSEPLLAKAQSFQANPTETKPTRRVVESNTLVAFKGKSVSPKHATTPRKKDEEQRNFLNISHCENIENTFLAINL